MGPIKQSHTAISENRQWFGKSRIGSPLKVPRMSRFRVPVPSSYRLQYLLSEEENPLARVWQRLHVWSTWPCGTGIEICTPGGIDLLKEMAFSGRFVVESPPFSHRWKRPDHKQRSGIFFSNVPLIYLHLKILLCVNSNGPDESYRKGHRQVSRAAEPTATHGIFRRGEHAHFVPYVKVWCVHHGRTRTLDLNTIYFIFHV